MQVVIGHLQCLQLLERYYALWELLQFVIVQIKHCEVVLSSLEVCNGLKLIIG
jgi:hypothetical protein